jgi:hypothetical protein
LEFIERREFSEYDNLPFQPLADALGLSFDYWQHPDNDRTV